MDDYQRFTVKLADAVQELAGKETIVSTKPVRRNNGVTHTAVLIRSKDQNAFPLMYPEPEFEQYQKSGDIEEAARSLLERYKEAMLPSPLDTGFFTDSRKASTKIVCRIISRDRNRQLLKDVPHRDFLNLSVVYYCLTDMTPVGTGAILIRNEHLRMWGIDCEALDRIARENTRKLLPYDFRSMRDMIASIIGQDIPPGEETEIPLYVLSNVERCFGAVWITAPDVLETIGKRLNEDFYILPSSVHECVVLPCREETDETKLQCMVREINSTQVRPEDVLADSVYRYHCQSAQLSVAAD